MWAELCIQTQIGQFRMSVCNLLIGYAFAGSIKTHQQRLVGLCLWNLRLQRHKNIEVLCLVLGKQCQSQKLNHLDKTDIYNGQNSIIDTFVSDTQMLEHMCPDYEDFSVCVCIYIYIYIGLLTKLQLI